MKAGVYPVHVPLFMDRHDLPGVSAADVAKAHARDLEVQEGHGVTFLSYWFDHQSSSAFCLARASTAQDMETVHRESHGLIPNEIIPVSEDAVLQFLGKVHDPENESDVTSAFRTILFTDLVDSTALAEELDSAEYLGLLAEHDLIIRRALIASRGREVKHTGDGMMISFDDVSNALECALAIREGFRTRNETALKPLSIRIGLAAGEPVDRDGDLFGPTVNLASRLCSVADPDSILVSDVVRDLGSTKFAFTESHPRDLKGIAAPVRMFELEGAA
jgi:class 3 adenylate cyclase